MELGGPLKGRHLRETKRQPREDLGRTSRHKEIARVIPEEGPDRHGAGVPKEKKEERRQQSKGFEDQCKMLDSILDARGGLGTVVHGHRSQLGGGLRAASSCDVTGL